MAIDGETLLRLMLTNRQRQREAEAQAEQDRQDRLSRLGEQSIVLAKEGLINSSKDVRAKWIAIGGRPEDEDFFFPILDNVIKNRKAKEKTEKQEANIPASASVLAAQRLAGQRGGAANIAVNQLQTQTPPEERARLLNDLAIQTQQAVQLGQAATAEQVGERIQKARIGATDAAQARKLALDKLVDETTFKRGIEALDRERADAELRAEFGDSFNFTPRKARLVNEGKFIQEPYTGGLLRKREERSQAMIDAAPRLLAQMAEFEALSEKIAEKGQGFPGAWTLANWQQKVGAEADEETAEFIARSGALVLAIATTISGLQFRATEEEKFEAFIPELASLKSRLGIASGNPEDALAGIQFNKGRLTGGARGRLRASRSFANNVIAAAYQRKDQPEARRIMFRNFKEDLAAAKRGEFTPRMEGNSVPAPTVQDPADEAVLRGFKEALGMDPNERFGP